MLHHWGRRKWFGIFVPTFWTFFHHWLPTAHYPLGTSQCTLPLNQIQPELSHSSLKSNCENLSSDIGVTCDFKENVQGWLVSDSMKLSEVEEEFHSIFEFEFSNSKWQKTLVHVEFIFAKLCEENFPSCPTEESTDKDIDCYQHPPKKVKIFCNAKNLKKCVQEEGGVGEVEPKMVILWKFFTINVLCWRYIWKLSLPRW